jgi:hypothetical protein
MMKGAQRHSQILCLSSSPVFDCSARRCLSFIFWIFNLQLVNSLFYLFLQSHLHCNDDDDYKKRADIKYLIELLMELTEPTHKTLLCLIKSL